MADKIYMIAGPNGAGKTTTARKFISDKDVNEFINADEIAKALSPLHPESVSLAASKLMLKRLIELMKFNKSFAFETTGAGTNYIKHLKQAKKLGYETYLIFLWLNHSNLAVERVATRVEQGGHNIPKDTIIRRYQAGLKNLVTHYLPLIDGTLILDNSIAGSEKIIVKKYPDGRLKIVDPTVWNYIKEMSNAE